MPERLSGSAVSQEIQNKILTELEIWKTKKWQAPKLTVVLVGEDPASHVYVGHKEKMCHKLGYISEVIRCAESTTEAELTHIIEKLNSDSTIDGILVQLPLPKHLNERIVLEKIDPNKDADCLTEKNIGKLLTGTSVVLPCTPSGIIEILKYYKIPIAGKNVAVIGRSLIVGMPLFQLLNKENATVTLFHSRSENIKDQLKHFDIVCVALGKPHFFKSSDFKNRAVVIDVGIHRQNDKLTGDVDLSSTENLSAFTPVPGGVGLMTIAMLMQNTLNLAKARRLK